MIREDSVYQPGVGHLLRYGSRRRVLAGLTLASLGTWAIYLEAWGVNPLFALIPAAILLAGVLLAPWSSIYLLATSLELQVARTIGRWSRRPFIIVASFAAYSLALGLALRPWDLSAAAVLAAGLAGSAVTRRLLRHAIKTLFAANVKGPSLFGSLVLLACVSMPLTLNTAAVVFPQWRPVFGVFLCVFGLRCTVSYFWVAIADSVERVRPFETVAPSRRTAVGILRLVRWTEHNLNRSLIERGTAGYLFCCVTYWLGGRRCPGFREAFQNLRIKRFYSYRKYAKVVDLTDRDSPGILLYLRAQSLIRLGRLDEAEALLKGAIAAEASNESPYLYLARAHLHLERSGFYSPLYRADIERACQLADDRLQRGEYRIECLDAVAEQAKISAFEQVHDYRRQNITPSGFPDSLRRPLRNVNVARSAAERSGPRLASEMRAFEGIIQSLAGDYSEAYIALEAALVSGENLKARYHLAVTLMVGSASFLRPIYHFERILALAPSESRLARLTRARLQEALRASWRNAQLACSWHDFTLVTFSQLHVERCEDESDHAPYIVLREDESKRSDYRWIFGLEPREFSDAGSTLSSREKGNEDIKKDVTVPQLTSQ